MPKLQKIAKHRSRGAFGARLDFRYAFGRDFKRFQLILDGAGKDFGGTLEGLGIDCGADLEDFR